MYIYHGTVERVVDGDTLDIAIDLGFKIYTKMRVRLYGVNTPEVYGVKKESEEYQKGQLASQYVKSWIEKNGPEFIIESRKDKQGKFGRYIVKLYNMDKTLCLNEDLISSGHAKEIYYD